MSGFIIYATRTDAEILRTWLNDAPEIAWIVKTREHNLQYDWRAVHQIESVEQQTYALWYIESGPLNIPSGRVGVPDAPVEDPFQGWSQTLKSAGATYPWFGGNLPGPFHFSFAEDGREAERSIARSEFSWFEDRYKSIGKPAHPAARRWWKRLRRFVERSTTPVPWVKSLSNMKKVPTAYLFPDAARQISEGRIRDINPWFPARGT